MPLFFQEDFFLKTPYFKPILHEEFSQLLHYSFFLKNIKTFFFWKWNYTFINTPYSTDEAIVLKTAIPTHRSSFILTLFPGLLNICVC